ncbi:MAG: UDP-N-acetylmuramoyl-L-alanine--D-glutamate ligase [Solirubrobacterales bacterium]|nr:UDP-N-acetylmuramoyl-L-alanine--D-glutamate ligase [Solirubrobacterales bacterium]
MRFSELDGASIGVWGAGREIGSFARQLARRLPSAQIVAAAFDSPPGPAELKMLGSPAPRIVGAAEAVEAMSGCALVVRSPGVSSYRPELQALGAAGVPVTTATALWLAERGGARVIGITGTKGKSTTAALAFHLARAAGCDVRLAGNIGVPALDLLDEQPTEVVVLELSSYQIADLKQGPEVALLTNLFREHTDWHGSEERYRADKLRLLGLPGVHAAVLNARDARLAELTPATPELHRYGLREGWDLADDGGLARREEAALAATELPLRGEHNALNLCGALTALEAIGVELPPLAPALADFAALPHRLQPILERDGVSWVDDSISTTPESSVAALTSFADSDVVLIAGGQDRGQEYGDLARALQESGATVIGVPSTGTSIVEAALAAGVAPACAREAGDLAAAVALAGELVAAGGVVLLSPAAPSYDHYRDFEQRGERFRELAEGA